MGASISGDARSTLELPSFAVPAKVGIYRVRVKLDWCNIDPAGDSDGKFGDFMDNGGQIVDFVLNVISETSVKGIGTDASQSSGIYDLSGRKIEKVVSPGLYIIDGRKVYVKSRWVPVCGIVPIKERMRALILFFCYLFWNIYI